MFGHLCPQLQLEDHRVDRVQSGRAAEPTGPPAWKPDRVVWWRNSDQRGLLCPNQQRHPPQPWLTEEQRRQQAFLVLLSNIVCVTILDLMPLNIYLTYVFNFLHNNNNNHNVHIYSSVFQVVQSSRCCSWSGCHFSYAAMGFLKHLDTLTQHVHLAFFFKRASCDLNMIRSQRYLRLSISITVKICSVHTLPVRKGRKGKKVSSKK